jgi:cell division transport system permease protein
MANQTFQRVFSVGWVNFKRNTYLSFGTTGVMVLVLILFSSLLAMNFISNKIVTSLEQKVDITAYFKNEASEEEIMVVHGDLDALPEVGDIRYVSRNEALDDFNRAHAGDPLITESLKELGDNPLQASLNIKATDSQYYANIVNFLEGNKYRVLIDKINFYENEQVINRVRSISGAVQNWGFLAMVMLAVVAVLVTFNTIRLTIYNQKQEIEIMKLVGGSNWFIRGPYLVEGALYGVFAAVIALAIFYPAVYVASPKISALIPEVDMFAYFIGNFYQFIPLIFAAGIILGVMSSMIAIRRFLHI